jgi:selenocysteine lyase/cysteine desulfurase
MNAFSELEKGVHAALETYSNIHRGSGHKSMVSTHLYEKARDIILDYLKLDKARYITIFCTPARAVAIKALLKQGSYISVSSKDIGLPLGVIALAAERNALPRGTPFQTGGGTTRVVSRRWVVWANAPEKFEAGTPPIINTITFAIALNLAGSNGDSTFKNSISGMMSAGDILYHDELESYSGKKLLDELKKTLIGQRVLVPTTEGIMPYVNLDNAASTPTFTPVWNAVRLTWRQPVQVQKEIIQEVRSVCAGMTGAPLDDYDVIFTSNTTEAINLAAGSFSREYGNIAGTVILNTILEHNSNDLPWRMVPNSTMIRLQVNEEGFVDLKELEKILKEYNHDSLHGEKRIRLVAVSGASNVLGAFNDLAEISRIVHQYDARLLVDAAQLIAHRKVNVEKLAIDYFAFSGHKAYAPFGCGILVVRKGLLKFSDAEMELIRSSGEENAAGIAGLGKALVILQRIGPDIIQEEEQSLTSQALRRMLQVPGIRLYGVQSSDSPGFAGKGGVVAFTLKGIFADKTAKALAEQGGIGIRSGCHCAHLLVKQLVNVGPGLENFQRLILNLLPNITLPGIARISLGIGNSEDDIDRLITVLNRIMRHTVAVKRTDIKEQLDNFVMDAERRVYIKLSSADEKTLA